MAKRRLNTMGKKPVSLAVSGVFGKKHVHKLFVSPLEPCWDPTGPSRECRERAGGHRGWWRGRSGQKMP
jgi:hypothetical protein